MKPGLGARLRWGAAIAALGFPPAAHAQAVNVEVHPAVLDLYDVRGRDIAQVKAAFGPGYVAHTNWHVNWKYGFLQASGGCGLTSFRVDVTAKIRMPRWVDRDRASPKDRATWDTFKAAMELHEEGHREHGIRAGREIARQVPGMGVRSNCKQLEADLAALAARVIETFNAADIEYDRVTRHGFEQWGMLK